jgi:hypothetical protein
MISFVYYFSNKRIENLEQSLRFLKKNENLFNCDVVLVCNEETNHKFNIPNYKLFNLNLETYNKPLLCNFGVNNAKNDIIALLDGDRILPKRYFEKMAIKLKRKKFISNLILHKLIKDYTDFEIYLKKYQHKIEIKSKKCEYYYKNLFSGCTLFYKKDYQDSGGMDESFEGYGFADNDMTINVLSKGYTASWNNAVEVHLHHPIEFLYKGKIINNKQEFKKISKYNLDKLKNKWQGKNIKNFIKII